MLVYGTPQRTAAVIETFALVEQGLAECRAACYNVSTTSHTFRLHMMLVELLIEAGEIEQSLTDLFCEEEDRITPCITALHTLTGLLGTAVAQSWTYWSEPCPGAGITRLPALLLDAQHALSALRTHASTFPDRLTISIPEGYAFYSLYPEQYLEAVRQFIHDHSTRRPCVVIGLRSIGTSLAAVVAGLLRLSGYQVESLTLRPRGHPFERSLAIAGDLRDRLAKLAADCRWLVVDEGPGFSCSSFGSTASLLYDLGVQPDDITFFPSWWGVPGEHTTGTNRQIWEQTRKYVSSFEEALLDRVPNLLFAVSSRLDGSPEMHYDTQRIADSTDMGGGQWRAYHWKDGAGLPAVNPQMERRKYLVRTSGGEMRWAKFAGLGRYGRETTALAYRLAGAVFSPRVDSLAYGFTTYQYLPEASPLRRCDASREFSSFAARYAAYRYQSGQTGQPLDLHPLMEMLRYNTAQALGEECEERAGRFESLLPALEAAPSVVIDGRLRPFEWLRCPNGRYLKTDSADHARDHFLVGMTDIAWDLAGVSLEFDIDRRVLVEDYTAQTGDCGIWKRLPFYRAAYLAFQTGLMTLSLAANADGDEAPRLEVELARYRDLLAQELAQTNTEEV